MSKKLKKKDTHEVHIQRQWGAEKRTEPLSALHDRPSTRAITLSRTAVVLAIIFWVIYVVDTVIREFIEGPHTFIFMMEAVTYLVVVTLLTLATLMYLMSRQGALQRFGKHVRVPRAELEQHFVNSPTNITVLVPSYAEETAVIRKTLLSAALQEFPNKRVVLLIDDKPNPTEKEVAKRLNATRALASDIMKLFAEPRTRLEKAYRNFHQKTSETSTASKGSVEELIYQYKWTVNFLENMAKQEKIVDHVDIFFTEQVLRGLAKDLELTKKALESLLESGAEITHDRVSELYRRLTWIFNTEIATFERKKYVSLSHEPNKAMNINSYIGLMGGNYELRKTPDGPALVPTKSANPDVVIPDSEFILNLDADSVLLPEYCLRLAYYLQEPGNERVAVAQTPYSSFRGAPSRIERLAAATTDIQHILQQGLTYYNATFWVGANAVIRKVALNDIVETEWVGGFEIKRYVQDRTVIEDTESTIDLAIHGWKLYNYPERLSYSATPPDFGSLVIQRRRWANGGLLILPKLFTRVRDAKLRNEFVSRSEIMLRLNYLASIAWASFCLILMLFYPYDGRLLSPFVALAATPYFIAMAFDLKYCGYRMSDVFRIYGFNIILLPVNLAGVLKSIQQALTNEKIPFARTPKVQNRTISQPKFILGPLLIIGFSIFTFIRSYMIQNWGNAAFAALNTILSVWAFISYIGVRNAAVDIWISIMNWLYVEPKQKVQDKKQEQEFDWQAALYHGHTGDKVPLTVSDMSVVKESK